MLKKLMNKVKMFHRIFALEVVLYSTVRCMDLSEIQPESIRCQRNN